MEVKREIIVSEFDHLQLEMESCVPERIKGIVQISHGMAEHKERYEPFMRYLAGHGYLAVIHDHRGHGSSVKAADERGYFYTEDICAIVDDLHQVTSIIRTRYPDVPVYLFSHSMGTLVARNYMKKYDDEIDKLILCGPPTKNPNAGLALWMAKISSIVKGEKYRNEFIHSLAFKGYDKAEGTINCWLTTDHEEVAAYNRDPLCGYIFTNNGFINLFQLMKESFSKSGWQKKNLQIPILAIAGEDDPVIQNKKKFEQMILFLKDLGYVNIQSRLYGKMRHELLNESERNIVYEDILKFLGG